MQEATRPQAYRILFYVEQNYCFPILRPIQAAAREAGCEVRWFFAGTAANPEFLDADEVRCQRAADAVRYRPDAVFVPGDRVPAFIPGIKVQVFHGLDERKRGNIYPERGMFDLYCTEGPGRTGMLEPLAAERGYFRVRETGWAKLDSLFGYKPDTPHYDRPQVLYSSTFTPRLSSAEALYEEIRRLSRTDKWQWLVTLHPKLAPETMAKYRSLANENLAFFENDKVIELLHRGDVMICDNSSILQEFLLLGKPVVTFGNRDPQPYMIDITDPAALEGSVEAALSRPPELMQNIAEYAPQVTPFRDGASAQRILAAVTEMLESGWQDRKPRNFFRNFKIRKQLNYFGF